MIKVKMFTQTGGYCGPASLKIVLSHYGINKSEKSLAKLAHATRESGCTVYGMISAAKKFGFKSYFRDNRKISDLRKYVRRGLPVIVDWFSQAGDGHYSVVVGFKKDSIVLADPRYETLHKISIRKFLLRWFDFPGDQPHGKSSFIVRRVIVIYR